MKTSFPSKPVVLGPKHGHTAGRIKTAYYGTNLCGLLVADGSRVSDNEHKMGSRLLLELFDEANMPRHKAAYEKFLAACAAGQPTLPFPDEMLPPVVLQWRSAEFLQGAPFDPSSFLDEPKPEPASPAVALGAIDEAAGAKMAKAIEKASKASGAERG